MTASMSEVAAKYTLPLSPVHKRAAAQAAAASTPKSKLPVLEALAPIYAKIDATKKTAYQKTVLKLLCQVPRGRVSTYGAIAKAMKSSPRAVGNALRENPLAPEVPCHRIVASDKSIGGFHGDWGINGRYYKEKVALLRDEGLIISVKGRVDSKPFEGFVLPPR